MRKGGGESAGSLDLGRGTEGETRMVGEEGRR